MADNNDNGPQTPGAVPASTPRASSNAWIIWVVVGLFAIFGMMIVCCGILGALFYVKSESQPMRDPLPIERPILPEDSIPAAEPPTIETKTASQQGNFKVGMADGFRKAAEHGNADAQLDLAKMYRDGEGVAEDYIEAYKWARLAGGGKGQTLCEALAKEMTPEQIAEAKRMATEFVPKSGELPDPKQGK